MDYADFEHLTFERRANGVLLIVLDRPERANAVNRRMHREMAEVWLTIARDPTVRVAVVTGHGKTFSAGGDVKEYEDPVEGFRQERVANADPVALEIVYNMLDLAKPIISAINGFATGAGLAVALTADISIIGDDVRIADGHMRMGLSSGDGAVMLWPWMCGIAKTKYYLLSADFLDGLEAERIGLVSRVVPTAEVLPQALQLADQLALSSQRALHSTKRSLNHVLRSSAPAFELSVAYQTIDFHQADAEEALTAFVEKRPAVFPSAPPTPA
jgi:enoyl-CoA hydratase